MAEQTARRRVPTARLAPIRSRPPHGALTLGPAPRGQRVTLDPLATPWRSRLCSATRWPAATSANAQRGCGGSGQSAVAPCHRRSGTRPGVRADLELLCADLAQPGGRGRTTGGTGHETITARQHRLSIGAAGGGGEGRAFSAEPDRTALRTDSDDRSDHAGRARDG